MKVQMADINFWGIKVVSKNAKSKKDHREN